MRKRGRRPPPRYLEADERDRLLALAADHPRDRAILTLFCFGGLRLNELCMLDRDDIDLERRTVLIRFAKGGKWRRVGLHPRAAEAVAAYLATRADDDPALFVSNRRRRIARRTVQDMLDLYTGRMGLSKRITPHCLRHTFAVAFYRQSQDIRLVQRALGHSNIQTTTIYLMLDDSVLYRAMDQL